MMRPAGELECDLAGYGRLETVEPFGWMLAGRGTVVPLKSISSS
jgi:hypothetical protein